MNYLVIDLEMCNVPRDYRSRSYKYANETIQIGAVLLDEEFKRIGTLSQYVHPEHGVIDPFIQNLTGIRNSQVKKAPRIEEALLHMIDWIGDREYKVYAWSGSDRAQLLHEIKELDTEVAVGEWIETVEYDYPGFHLSMDCFWCEIVKGDLVLKEHEAARWLTREELTDVGWLPADVAVAEKIEGDMTPVE